MLSQIHDEVYVCAFYVQRYVNMLTKLYTHFYVFSKY